MSSKSDLDKIDKNIISLLQKDPEITYSEIASKVGRSQPAIEKRIKKLERYGFLSYQTGLNIRTSDFIYLKIELNTKNPDKILKKAKKCPFMTVAFKVSGENDVIIIAYGEDLRSLTNLIYDHFKDDKDVISISLEIILDVNKDLVLPIELDIAKCKYIKKDEQNS